MLTTPQTIRTLQRKLYAKAKTEPAYRFYALYDKVYRADILSHAWRLVRSNGGGPGIDGTHFGAIERGEGVEGFLRDLARELQEKTYRAQPVRRVMIPKADGSQRPLGIPTIRDRVAQMAVKLVIEPIFEADFCDNSYGFRPKRSAHDAVDDIANALWAGHTQVIDADLSKYFDSIPHAKLLAVVAERIVDGGILALIKQWLKAPVIGEDKQGKRKTVGGGKANSQGTPQGGVISPLLANAYLHLLDRIWERHRLKDVLGAQLVRYADDFVVVCKRGVETAAGGASSTGAPWSHIERGQDPYRGRQHSGLQLSGIHNPDGSRGEIGQAVPARETVGQGREEDQGEADGADATGADLHPAG